MASPKTKTATPARATSPAPASPPTPAGGATEIRINVAAAGGEEVTEYTVVTIGGGDKTRGYNVSASHDPNGEFILPQHANTPDAALQAFKRLFDKDTVSISGGGDAFAVVHDGKVLAVEKTRPAAVAAADKLAKKDQVTGIVYPATTAVAEMFDAVGTEGTRIDLNHSGSADGLVTLAR